MIRVRFRNFIIIKICNFIAMRFYFGFLKKFIIDRFTIKFYFDISTDKSPSSLKQYIHLVCPS